MGEKNIKCSVSYDGTLFHGFQIQPNQRTVQNELEKAISSIAKKKINIYASGRTDAGVHANQQVINFNTESSVPPEKWRIAMNSILPEDIIITDSQEVSMDFHARYNVKQKTYRYYLYNSKLNDVFRRNYWWHYPYEIDIEKMIEASKYFIGEHDFTSFSSSKTAIENKVRTVYDFNIQRNQKNELIFEITGNGFLYNMVRIIVGSVVDVGRGRMKLKKIPELLEKKEKQGKGPTAPAHGLYLWEVKY